MSDVRRGRICLFWCTAADATELTVGHANRIDIDVTPLDTTGLTQPRIDTFLLEENRPAPDARTFYAGMNPPINRFDTKNPAPFSENTPRPDTGFSGLRIDMDLVFVETERVISASNEKTYRAGAIARLVKWSRSDNSVRGLYKHGRLGMRNDYRPEYNVTPDNYGGYKIISFDPSPFADVPYFTRAKLILQYSGAPGLIEEAGDAEPRLGRYDELREDTS